MPSRPSPSARLRLVTGPAGSGKTNAALERVRAAATTGSAARTLLILPTYAQVTHVKRVALSRWGVRGIVDAPFATFTSAGERFLSGFRVRALPSAEERDRLMEEALRQRDVEPFRGIRDRIGFRAHLLRLVKELKQTGLEGGEVREQLASSREHVGVASREKLDAFLEVFECYEDLLERAGLSDHEDTLRRLARELEDRPPSAPPQLLAVDGFDDFTPVEEHILETLSDVVAAAGGEVLVTLPWDPARPALFSGSGPSRERFLARGFVEEPLAGFPRSGGAALARLATSLFGERGDPVPGGEHVRTLVAGDAEDEAETIARTVRRVVEREAVPGVRGWRDVGVVVRRLGDHAARLRGAFDRLGVPLRIVGHGEILAGEPLVRALRGPLAVVAGDTGPARFDARSVLEWLRWRSLAGGGDVDAVAIDRFDMRCRSKGLPADFEAFRSKAPEAIAPVLAELDEAAAHVRAAPDAAARYERLADALVRLAPLPEPSGFDERGTPLDAAHDGRLARDVAARARLTDILAALGRAARRTALGGAPDAAHAVRELLEAMERTTLRLPDRRLDAVTLLDAETARFWDLPVVVVAGLEEGEFPLRPREDMLLRDADREALRTADRRLRLPLAREREAHERRLFYAAVTRADTRLYLSRRAYDDKGDPREASFFLGELEAVVTPEPAHESRTPGRVARRRDDCFTRTDWLLFAAARRAPWSARRSDIPPEERELAAAIQAVAGTAAPRRVALDRRREADALWEDEAGREAALAQFADATARVSVSRLNTALTCERRLFLHYVAGIPRDEHTLDGPKFDFLTKGKALHHSFEHALREPACSSEDAARAGVEHVGARGIEARLLAWELGRAVTLLRDRDERTGMLLMPWLEGLEFDFYANPVPMGPEDCRFGLGGFVDRIDRAGKRAAIMDYKRSATSAERGFVGARDGTDLQLPLYALAVEALTGLEVVGFEWVAGITRYRRIIHDEHASDLFAGRRESKVVVTEPHDAFRARMADAERTAAEVVRHARTGAHERRPAEVKSCGDCAWSAVCRPDLRWVETRIEQAAVGEGVA